MKKIKEMLRRIGTAGLAAMMLTAQMPVPALAEEPTAVEQDGAEASDEEQQENDGNGELTAEKPEVETDGDTAIAETGGFSLYTVEFSYDSKQYVLPGDSEVALSEVLDTVGLTGEVSAVGVSDTSLFSAKKNEGGKWIVTAHKAFGTKEWMKVTIGGMVYEIAVTDAQTMTWGTLGTILNNNDPSGRVTLKNDVTAGDGDSALVIPRDKRVTLDLASYTINANNKFGVIEVRGNLTLTDSSSGKTGKLTGGIGDSLGGRGGGVFVKGGTFTMEGGTISGCMANGRGGGVFVNSEGTFTMSGGTISGCTAYEYGGGGVSVYSGKFNMNGGTISGCSAFLSGGGVYVGGDYSEFTMKGGTISGCEAKGDGVNGGGGVYVDENGTFTMEGGTISGCTATNHGGGVFVNDNCTFQVSGAPVIKDNSANNVALNYGTIITVTGALEPGAEIHINANKGTTVAEKGSTRTDPLTETEAGYFKSDVDSNLLGVLNVEGQVVLKDPLPALTGASNLIYNGTEQTPALTFEDATLTADEDYTVSYKKDAGGTETEISGAPKGAGSYKAVVTGTGSYAGTSEAAFTIDRKEVTVSSGIAAKDKTYDGTAAAALDTTGAVFDGICTGDSLTVSGTGTFADASAGSDKNVTISSLTLGGTSSANYVLASGGNQTQTTATINKKKLTITGVTAADKEYDGNTTATTDTTDAMVTGLVDAETVAFTVSGNFADANKGENKTVTLSGWTLTSGGNNYEIDADKSQKTTTAGITVMQVYITGITAENKEYDGNKTATVSGAAVLKKVKDDNIISDLSVSNITAEFADKNVGDGKAVSITGGTLDSDNYTLIPGKTTGLTANITPKQVIITGLSAKDKVYDTTTAATTIGTAVIDGKIGNDDVTVSAGTAAFDNANVSDNKTVTFADYSLTGADASNYALSAQPENVTANITKATPTIIAPAASPITYGQNLSNSTLTNGAAKLGEHDISGTFDWNVPTIAPAVSDSNQTEYTVTFTPDDTTNLNQTTCKVKLTVNKADISADQLTAPAKIEDLKYTGQAQALISSGSVSGNIGTMQYALGTDDSTSPTSGWGKVIPTATDAGT